MFICYQRLWLRLSKLNHWKENVISNEKNRTSAYRPNVSIASDFRILNLTMFRMKFIPTTFTQPPSRQQHVRPSLAVVLCQCAHRLFSSTYNILVYKNHIFRTRIVKNKYHACDTRERGKKHSKMHSKILIIEFFCHLNMTKNNTEFNIKILFLFLFRRLRFRYISKWGCCR